MRHTRSAVLLLFVLIWLPGCGFAQNCNDVGSGGNIPVSGDPDLTREEAQSLELDVCSADKCWIMRDGLHKAKSGYTRDWVNWVRTGSLPDGELQVSGSYRHNGALVELPPVTVDPQPRYANGEDCGNSGSVAAVRLTAEGLQDVTTTS